MSSDKPGDNWTGDYTSRHAQADDETAAAHEARDSVTDATAVQPDSEETPKAPEPVAQEDSVAATATGPQSPESDQSAGAAAAVAAAATTAPAAQAAPDAPAEAAAAAQPVKKKRSWYVRLFGGVIWLYEHLPNALIALLARVSIGLVFWMSGRTKVDGVFEIKDSTFFLFKEEYKMPITLSFGDTQFTVPFTDPVTAAYITTAAEHVLPLLLWIGFCTRFAATGLLIMVCVISFWVYPDASPATWALHGLWAAVLLYLMRFGPGALSIDHLFRRRLMDN